VGRRIAVLAALLLAGLAAHARSLEEGLGRVLAEVRFIAYTPREFAVADGVVRPATPAGVRADLARLRPHFDGLVTYSAKAGHEHVPAVAAELGFRALILGVWDPADAGEREAAVRLAREYPALVTALAVGNEGLFWRRYDWPTLQAALGRVREALPGVPVTTSEPFAVYLDGAYPGFAEAQDLLLPNVHPTFEPWFRPEAIAQAADFVGQVVERLRERFGKPVLVKETGLPAGPPAKGYTEARQAELWRALRARLAPDATQAFAYFEAFDAPWKPAAQALDSKVLAPEEAWWGLFDGQGRPRATVRDLPPLEARARAPRTTSPGAPGAQP
jgi:exo-beta-1,3-glucanase (GH17 family)